MSKKLIGGLMVMLLSLGMGSMANAQCWGAPRHGGASLVINGSIGGVGVGFYSGPARVMHHRPRVVYRAVPVPVYTNTYYGGYPQGYSNEGCNNQGQCNNGYYNNNCNNNTNCNNNGYSNQNSYDGYYQQQQSCGNGGYYSNRCR